MAEYHNPQQEPGLEKRLLLIFGITFLVILISQSFLSRYVRPPEPARKPQQTASNPASRPPLAPEPRGELAKPAVASRVAKGAPEQASTETEIVIENDLYRVTFTNRGAHVKSWILKKYNNDKGQPLELVHPIAAPQYGYPLSLYVYDENLHKKLDNALYLSTATGRQNTPSTVSFEFADGDTTVRKVFRFDNSYVVRVEASVLDKGSGVPAFPSWPAGFGDQTVASSYAAGKVEWDSPEKVNRVGPDAKKLIGGNTIRGPFRWASTADQYFAAVFLPDDENSAAMVTLHNLIEIPKNLNQPDPNEKDKVHVLGAAVGDLSGATRERLFVGPKALHILANVHSGANADGPDLQNLVDFGFFGFIAKPLFLWLRWTYEHWVANWGWAILTLTFIINVVLLPLRISTMKSSMKMMKLQPQIQAINEKYKKYKLTDPRMAEKNKDVADLYKREGVNPVGGCFPTLLQIPFLFAFYSMLGSTIELRHAPWLWIKDLSSPDPWHLIPILFVVSMFFMQKLTPQGGMDPMQQKMMAYMMPLFLGFISWNLASGLGIYWAAGNLIGIAQQLIMNRTQFGREMRAHLESRARKK